MLRKSIIRVAVAALMILGLGGGAFASPITEDQVEIIGTSGGSPGGFDVYQINDLVQGQEFTIHYDFTGILGDKEVATNVFATAHIVITELSDEGAIIDVEIWNDSTLESTVITIFGMSVHPFDGLDGTTTDGTNLSVQTADSIPGFKNNIELAACAGTAGSNLCQAGDPQLGIAGDGGHDAFTFSFLGDYTDGIALDSFAIKVQADPDSFELPGTPWVGQKVPEPASLAIFAFGLLGLGFFARRRQLMAS